MELNSIFRFAGSTFKTFDLSYKCAVMTVTMLYVIQRPNILNSRLFLLNNTLIKTTFIQLILIKLTGFLLHESNVDSVVFESSMNSAGTSFTTNGIK